MQTILHYLSDTPFLIRYFTYLETCHGIRALVVDKKGSIDPLDGQDTREYPQKRVYPIPFQEDIGGIRCSAKSVKALRAADPHIQIGIAGLESLLGKDLVLQQTMDEMLHLSDQLHFLFDLAAKLSGVHDLEEYCTLMLEEISAEIFADSAFVHMKNHKKDRRLFLYKVAAEEVKRIERDPAVLSLPEKRTAIVSLRDGNSALVIPIKEKDKIAGRFVLMKEAGKRNFSAYEKQFASIINNIICPTIESLSLYSHLQILYLNTVKALAAAIDAKDAYTHGHSFRVARFSLAIGRRLYIDSSQVSDLEIAAYMHDLGKIGVPESILGKEGRLSPEEFDEIKKHPLMTNKILEPIDLPDLIVQATLQHHERMDGRGYPFGLKGEEISLFARIIAVADVFDALTSARPYRNAMTVEAALTEISDGIDKEYDHNVVLALIDALRRYTQDPDLSTVYLEPDFKYRDQLEQFLEKLAHMLPNEPNPSLEQIVLALKTSDNLATSR